MRFITGTFHALAILLLVAVAGLFLASALPIPGNIEIKVVKSGSMEPAIPVGALVVIKPVATYAVGDVITFGKDTKTEIPTTHRILSIRESNGVAYYTTKGDANEEQDPKEVRDNEIIGKVLVNVPGAGYVLDFAKQPLGFALMIALPAAIIILDELLAIYREIRRRMRPKSKGPDDGRSGSHLPKEPESGGINMRSFHTEVRYMRRYVTDDIFLPVRVRIQDVISSRQYTNATTSALTIAALMISAGNIGGTLSYFRDTELSSMNLFGAGVWEEEVPLKIEEELTLQALVLEEGAENATSTEASVDEPEERSERAERPEREERQERENPRGGSGSGGGGGEVAGAATSTEGSSEEETIAPEQEEQTGEDQEEATEETTEESTEEEVTEEETLPPATVEDTPVVETEEEAPPAEPPPPPLEESVPAETPAV